VNAHDIADDRYREYVGAALNLAGNVSTQDRIKRDPGYCADRSERANEARAQMFADALERYRRAEAAFLLEVTA